MKKISLAYLIFISLLFCQDITAQKPPVDSLKTVLIGVTNHDEVFMIIRSTYVAFYKEGDMKNVEDIIDFGLSVTNEWNSKVYYARLLYSKSRVFDFYGNLDNAYSAMQRGSLSL